MDRLTGVRVFVTVAERGSLTQAADQLDMSAAMVSRYLAAVEGWFGARLLHRTTRRISLTDAGQAALPRCRQLLDLSEDIEHLAGEHARVPRGTVRVTTALSFAEAQLTAALTDFQRLHDQVDIALSVGDGAADLVSERVDLAIRVTNALDPTMIARQLARCHSVLCAAPAYLAAHGEPRTLDDLLQHQCVSHGFGTGAQYRFTRAGETFSVPVGWRFHTNETVVLRRAVLAGAGICMLPTYLVGDDVRRGDLVRLLPDYEPEQLGIHAIYLSRQHQPLALRLLVDFLAERFGGPVAPWDRALP